MRSIGFLLFVMAAMTVVGCAEGDDVSVPTFASVATMSPSATADVAVASLTPSVTMLAATPTESDARILVTRVIDGDTIEVAGGQRVRYIGMDTPENTSTRECFGDEATQRNRELVEGKLVELEKDVSETDRFGRLLRYVWVDGRMVNEVLVAEGLASVSTFPPDVRYVERFLALEGQARSSELGLWSACIGDGQEPTVESGDGCDDSYPDVCIPPYPPDLDCGEILQRRFRVVGSDPHGFDGDNDGVGCESG